MKNNRLRKNLHKCHAYNCQKEIDPKLLMCFSHWNMVPAELKRQVYKFYVPGQEVRKDPTKVYLSVAQKVIDYVYEKEREEFLDTWWTIYTKGEE